MTHRQPILAAAVAATFSALLPAIARAQDSSAAATLQLFESTWQNTESRAADAFLAGYGSVWVPPPGRASGGFSVGYDQFDRFDLGSWDNPTLYGTERAARTTIDAWHRFGGKVIADLVWNHNAFADQFTGGFSQSGGYPGFVLDAPGHPRGDFHSTDNTDVYTERLAGLIDINHATNLGYVRNPVDASDPRNVPAGTTDFFGRPAANVADAANRRFYASQSGPGRTLFDPRTNETFTVYDFKGDGSEITSGTPTVENALGYLQRNAQWYVQDVGFDGFRLDATKHMQPWVLNYLDRAVHNANPRRLLDGSVDRVFSFGEAFSGDMGLLQDYVRKDYNPADPNRVAGNRDSLDFPLHFALKAHLKGDGFDNDWTKITNASFDRNDDGFANNGSQGVAFDASHDENGAGLGNVANAFLAMRPGNWVVYQNAKQFGDNRDFPKDGRGDALGGLYGDTVTTLVNVRNTHGRGDYVQRHVDKETLVYEREGSAIVGLNNRLDGGFDSRWIDTSFAGGTRLIELTGNADDPAIDSRGDIPGVIKVEDDGRVEIKVPRNVNPDGGRHDTGYVIYGLPTPRGTMTLGGVSRVLEGGTPTDSTNGTTRLADLHVVTGETFTVNLQLDEVTLVDGYRDFDADGDNAIVKVNGGIDLNGNGYVDNSTPNSTAYGFEQFGDKSSPLLLGGDGEFVQTVDASQLSEGVNFVEARAFRRRTDGGPAVYMPFKQVVYVDRLKPESGVFEINSLGVGRQQFLVESLDNTANSVHVFANLPENVDPLSRVDGGNKAGQVDRDLFAYGFDGLLSGNNVLTVVTYEITGSFNVQRFTGLGLDTGLGGGVGDVNGDGSFGANDVFGAGAFEQFLYSRDDQFNAAADADGDGRVTALDLFELTDLYRGAGATAAADEARQAELRRGNVNEFGLTDAFDIDDLFAGIGGLYRWSFDLSSNDLVDLADVDLLVEEVFDTAFGDADLDGLVGDADRAIVEANYGGRFGWAGGDFTGDGLVNDLDLAVLDANFGFSRAAVPEPTTTLVLTLTGLGLSLRRRRPHPHPGRVSANRPAPLLSTVRRPLATEEDSQ